MKKPFILICVLSIGAGPGHAFCGSAPDATELTQAVREKSLENGTKNHAKLMRLKIKNEVLAQENKMLFNLVEKSEKSLRDRKDIIYQMARNQRDLFRGNQYETADDMWAEGALIVEDIVVGLLGLTLLHLVQPLFYID